MEKIDSDHPYYLHASDSSGMTLVHTAFDGIGYGSQRKSILIALSAKNKLGFIDGSTPRPAAIVPTLKNWTRSNDVVFAWMLNSLSPNIRSSVIHFKSARDLWKQLENRHDHSNLAQLFELQKQQLETTQGSNNIATYFNNMKAIWDEIEALDTKPTCPCVNCTFGASEKIKEYEERQKLVQFLMGLNESYTACRGNIMMMQSPPNVDREYFLLLLEEIQRAIQHISSHPGDSNFFYATGHQFTQTHNNSGGGKFNTPNSQNKYNGGKGNSGYKKSLYCINCKRTNHTADRCFQLHGFPNTQSNSQINSVLKGT